jgi:hypothetical protein
MAPSSAADRSGYYAPNDETSYEAPQDRQRIRQYGAKKVTYPVTPASGPCEGSRPPERESTYIARLDFGAQNPVGEYELKQVQYTTYQVSQLPKLFPGSGDGQKTKYPFVHARTLATLAH